MGMLCLWRRDSTQYCGKGWFLYLVHVMFIWIPPVYNGYELPQCSDGWITFDETAPNSVVCTGILNDNVTWIVRDTVSSVDLITLGYCEPSGTCYSSFAGVRQITREFNRTDLTVSAYQRGKFSGKILTCSGNSVEGNCSINLIHIAVIGPCTVGVTVNWEVTGSCQVGKVFSSRDEYICSWYTSQVNKTESSVIIAAQVFNKSSFMESGLQYYRGHCNFTQTFPAENGVFTYFFAFEPGPSGGWKESLKIEPPDAPPIHNCPLYVAEESTLHCDCTNARPGKPPAVLSWGADSQSYQLRLDDVRRDQNGREYTCSQTWGRGVQTTKYTLQAAYGPEDKDLSISGSSSFTTNGTRTLTLSCQVSNTNPTPQYTWTGVTCNDGGRGSRCSFTPHVPGDDGKVVTCTATNTWMSTDIKTATATYNVTLNYPPSKIVTTGYNSSDLLIEGNREDLAAAAGGGVAAAVVIIAIVVGIVLFRKYCGRNTYDRPLPRQQDDNNYTGLVLYEDVGSSSRQRNTYDTPLPRQAESSTYTGLALYDDVGIARGTAETGDCDGCQNAGFQDGGSYSKGTPVANAKDKSDHTYQNE